ncbi:MAG: hypothetical protein IKB07_01190 [Lachnospiraceae bacterium]|nr:hypothetical protein [Lachnospiraceae bacterium]
MRNRKSNRTLKKRAVATGLFLGILCTLGGCVRPTVQPTGTPEPTKEISENVTQSPIEEVTPVPTVTQPPEITPEPTRDVEIPTGRPTPSLPTGVPDVSPTPVTGGAISVTPEVTPEPTEAPEVTPEPTEVPEVTPEPTEAPEVTPKPTEAPEVTPEPTEAPEVTPKPTEAPEVTPEPTEAPEVTPKPTEAPEITPEPTEAPEITPEPTEAPEVQSDYEVLIQNGWQRTEDFFVGRSIYFSGRFTQTELLTEPGRYEYRYTTTEDAEAVFSIIGEELPVQTFLDELTQKGPACEITKEAEEDYGYRYTEQGRVVFGRVYACFVEEKEYRMRIEMSYSIGTESQTEEYRFYLK